MKLIPLVFAAAATLSSACFAMGGPPGTGGGYVGGSWYSSGQGSVVGPYATAIECQQALNNAINNAVNNFGWSVVSIQPCHYKPPFGQVRRELSAVESAEFATALNDQVIEAHRRLRVEQFEAMVCEIVDPNEDEDFDKEASARCVGPR